MVEILPDERLQQVMDRTLFNLKFVKRHAGKNGPFEVVQLVNSFLGAMAHPWEEMNRLDALGLRTYEIERARFDGWPVLDPELPSDAKLAYYGDMLLKTRHSFAHGNIEFINENGTISEIRFWNNYFRTSNREWGACATPPELESFLRFFRELASGRVPKARTVRPRIFSYAAAD